MTCPVSRYLDRTPEHLVIGGYRGTMKGDPNHCPAVEAMWRIHEERLGSAESRIVVDGLAMFMNTLRRAALCPLRALPDGACHLCRDECMVLSLVASLQHGDDLACRLATQTLAGAAHQAETVMAAGEYAMRLKMFGQVLLPIPPLVIADILAGPPQHAQARQHTIH